MDLAPLNDALVREKKLVNTTFRTDNPFKGPPSEELDHAWHTLFVNSNVRVTADDLKKIDRTSVPIGDGNGYYAIPSELTSPVMQLSAIPVCFVKPKLKVSKMCIINCTVW